MYRSHIVCTDAQIVGEVTRPLPVIVLVHLTLALASRLILQ